MIQKKDPNQQRSANRKKHQEELIEGYSLPVQKKESKSAQSHKRQTNGGSGNRSAKRKGEASSKGENQHKAPQCGGKQIALGQHDVKHLDLKMKK